MQPRPQIVPARHAIRAAERLGGEIHAAGESVASEVRAVWSARPIGAQGVQNFRKWLGWAAYRFASWVNPEIDEPW